MKKIIYYLPIVLFLFLFSCRKNVTEIKKDAAYFAKTITAADLNQHLSIISGADMEGRNTPSAGLEKAAQYIIGQLEGFGVKPGNSGSFRQTWSVNAPYAYSPDRRLTDFTVNFSNITLYQSARPLPIQLKMAESPVSAYNSLADTLASNIIGVVEGSDKKDEFVIVSAHYDHVGKNAQGAINYGADDNGSGTAALLELAEAFAMAKKEGISPRRTLLFLAVSGEEKGLWGSAYYNNHPVFPTEKTSVNLNLDMIGRVANEYLASADSSNYIFLIGDHKLSSSLAAAIDSANKNVNLKLDRKYNDPNDPLRLYYRSDHYSFAKKGIPAVLFFSGLHPHYHTPADTIEKINFEALTKRAQLVFYTAWAIANMPGMLPRDLPL